jgi:hypothetical protein
MSWKRREAWKGSSGLAFTNRLKGAVANSWALFVAGLIVAFPKCPLCWAGYFSALGLSGMASLMTSNWILPLVMALMTTHLYILYRRARQRGIFLPFHLSSIGFASLATGLASGLTPLRYLGLILVMGGAITNSLSFRTYLFLWRRFPVPALVSSGIVPFRRLPRAGKRDVSSISTLVPK